MVQWLRLHAPNSGGLVSNFFSGTRSHMPQLKSSHATTKNYRMSQQRSNISCVATKTQHSQINKINKNKY